MGCTLEKPIIYLKYMMRETKLNCITNIQRESLLDEKIRRIRVNASIQVEVYSIICFVCISKNPILFLLLEILFHHKCPATLAIQIIPLYKDKHYRILERPIDCILHIFFHRCSCDHI